MEGIKKRRAGLIGGVILIFTATLMIFFGGLYWSEVPIVVTIFLLVATGTLAAVYIDSENVIGDHEERIRKLEGKG